MKYLSRIIVCFGLLVLAPPSAAAALSISEIAWMGDSDSANNEWIELHNSGTSPIDITGWQLRDGNTLSIDLEGIVPANSYVVLERNRSSEQYLFSPPFLVYTGALVNSGATLTLYQSDGSIADQVAGGEDWVSIGGDNSTKETPQYTSSGWVTASPTPGAAASGGTNNAANTNTTTTTTTTASAATHTSANTSTSQSTTGSGSTSSGPAAAPLVPQPSRLMLRIDAPTTAYVGQPVELAVSAQGVVQVINNSLRYRWNLGNTHQATSSEVTHTYDFPGEYVVTVSGEYARHAATTRHTLTVLPVTVSMARTEAGDIHIHNNAPYEVDVSGYRVVGDRRVVFPPHSAILPQGTVTIAQSRLTDAPATPVALYDRGGALVTHTPLRPPQSNQEPELAVAPSSTLASARTAVASAPPVTVPRPTAASPVPTTPAPATPSTPAHFTFASAEPERSGAALEVAPNERLRASTTASRAATATTTATTSPLVASTGGRTSSSWWTSGGLILLLGATILGLWWQRRLTRPT